MRIVIGTLTLGYPGGTETYCLTVARELDRLGHDVTLFAEKPGPLAERAGAGGFDVAWSSDELPVECDAVLANDAITAGLLSERFTGTRLVYFVHSPISYTQLPPLAPGLVDALVAPSERFAKYARALALAVPVIRLTQPIDLDWFTPSSPPRSPPRAALVLGNYLDGSRRDALLETWAQAGIACTVVGRGTELSFDVRRAIAAADIVVGKARAALEGMACGKAVYVFDAWGGDGWVTSDSYPSFEADSFSGLAGSRPIDRGQLAADLERYDPEMGWINRELAVTHHSARSHAYELVEILRGPKPRRPEPGSSGTTARLVRTAWHAEGRAFAFEREALALGRQVAELTARAEAAGAIAAERDAWRARALEAERQLEGARKLIGTRRVHMGLALGRCLDRMLGRR